MVERWKGGRVEACQYATRMVGELDYVGIKSIWSRAEPSRRPTHILPTPLYIPSSPFGTVPNSRAVSWRILRSFSFAWSWARVRDRARWEVIA